MLTFTIYVCLAEYICALDASLFLLCVCIFVCFFYKITNEKNGDQMSNFPIYVGWRRKINLILFRFYTAYDVLDELETFSSSHIVYKASKKPVQQVSML